MAFSNANGFPVGMISSPKGEERYSSGLGFFGSLFSAWLGLMPPCLVGLTLTNITWVVIVLQTGLFLVELVRGSLHQRSPSAFSIFCIFSRCL
jgi:hypothetical protein